MNFLKRLWCKLFRVKVGAYSTDLDYIAENVMIKDFAIKRFSEHRKAYDPSLDPDKILKGEIESYFD